jgi:hypothetical protein
MQQVALAAKKQTARSSNAQVITIEQEGENMQTRTSRRGFLRASVASSAAIWPLGMLGTSTLLGGALIPTTSRAQVMEAMMVASAVSGLIAARKKGDGGIGAMMQANLQYQRVMSEQLQSLQTGMAEVLKAIQALSADLRAMLRAERLGQLHGVIGASIIQYHETVKAAADSGISYQEWTQDRIAREWMLKVRFRLSEAITLVKQERWRDATTSLYLPAAMFANLGAMSFLGMRDGEMKSFTQNYLDMMESAVSDTAPSTIGGDLAMYQQNVESRLQRLKQEGVELPPPESSRPVNVVLGGVNVQDMRPAEPEQLACKMVKERRGGRGTGTGEGSGPDDWYPVCKRVKDPVPEWHGDTKVFVFLAKVGAKDETMPGDNESQFGVRQFSLSEVSTAPGWLKDYGEKRLELIRRGPHFTGSLGLRKPVPNFTSEESNSSSAHAINTFGTVRAKAPSDASKLAVARESSQRKAMGRREAYLRAELQALNLDVALLALNAGAVDQLNQARRDAFAFFGMKAST